MEERKNELIQEVKEALSGIYEKGFEIRDILKNKYNYQSGRPVEEILTDHDLFFYSLFESFWKLFKMVSNDIENCLVQPWIRVLLEQSYDIFYLQGSENKEVASKYWLCALGFVGGEQGNLNYDNFLNFLDDSKKKSKFFELKEKGYLAKDVHRLWHKLFPDMSEDNMPKFIEGAFINVKGNPIGKSQLDLFYRDMSLYHHPNIIMENLEREFKDKSHIFRCFSLISMCGMSVIKFLTNKVIKQPEKNFDEKFYRKVNELINKLHGEKKDGI